MQSRHPRSDTARVVDSICDQFGRDRTRMMDIALEVQRTLGHVDDEIVDDIAHALDVPRVDVKSLVTFYTFLRHEPAGEISLRVCNDVVDRQQGADAVASIYRRLLDGQIPPRLGLIASLHDESPG